MITEAGNDPKVAGLVYIAAFAPDAGESVAALIKIHRLARPSRRYCRRRTAIYLSTRQSSAPFAADVGQDKAAFMANSQVPWGVEALSGRSAKPAWKTKPSWYLVATDDKMIPPPAQHFMSKRAGSTVSRQGQSRDLRVQPEAVAALIEQAAKGVKSAAK